MNEFDMQIRIDNLVEKLGAAQEQLDECDICIERLEAEVKRLRAGWNKTVNDLSAGMFVTAKRKGQIDARQGWVISLSPLWIVGQSGEFYECEGVPVRVINPPERKENQDRKLERVQEANASQHLEWKAANRTKELEKEVKRVRAETAIPEIFMCRLHPRTSWTGERECPHCRAQAAEVLLDKIAGLPEKWQFDADSQSNLWPRSLCAAELRAALTEDQS